MYLACSNNVTTQYYTQTIDNITQSKLYNTLNACKSTNPNNYLTATPIKYNNSLYNVNDSGVVTSYTEQTCIQSEQLKFGSNRNICLSTNITTYYLTGEISNSATKVYTDSCACRTNYTNTLNTYISNGTYRYQIVNNTPSKIEQCYSCSENNVSATTQTSNGCCYACYNPSTTNLPTYTVGGSLLQNTRVYTTKDACVNNKINDNYNYTNFSYNGNCYTVSNNMISSVGACTSCNSMSVAIGDDVIICDKDPNTLIWFKGTFNAGTIVYSSQFDCCTNNNPIQYQTIKYVSNGQGKYFTTNSSGQVGAIYNCPEVRTCHFKNVRLSNNETTVCSDSTGNVYSSTANIALGSRLYQLLEYCEYNSNSYTLGYNFVSIDGKKYTVSPAGYVTNESSCVICTNYSVSSAPTLADICGGNTNNITIQTKDGAAIGENVTIYSNCSTNTIYSSSSYIKYNNTIYNVNNGVLSIQSCCQKIDVVLKNNSTPICEFCTAQYPTSIYTKNTIDIRQSKLYVSNIYCLADNYSTNPIAFLYNNMIYKTSNDGSVTLSGDSQCSKINFTRYALGSTQLKACENAKALNYQYVYIINNQLGKYYYPCPLDINGNSISDNIIKDIYMVTESNELLSGIKLDTNGNIISDSSFSCG